MNSTTISHVTIGSRGSDLALWQANHVRDVLLKQYPDLTIDIKIIHTSGDKILDTPLAQIGGKGVFTKEIEEALLRNEIDIAVHSLKDLPTEIDPRLTIAAVPERANVEDVFLSADPEAKLAELPHGAWIATGSLRRRSQLLHQRPDFQITDIRGNVPTRIKKMQSADWNGMILARAGVERLGLTEFVRHTISTEWILPAVGQGALGIQTRSNDTRIIPLLEPLNDTHTLAAVTAERALLRALGGGCQVPIGAHAKVVNHLLELTACVVHPEGLSMIKSVHTGEEHEAERIGGELAQTLLDQGARPILDLVSGMESDVLNVNPSPEV